MKRIPARFIKWLANFFGYEILMIKLRGNVLTIESDPKVLDCFDETTYIFGKDGALDYDEDLKDWDVTLLDGLEND